MWKKILFVLPSLISMGCVATERVQAPHLQTVPYVDVKRYMGVWYEIARYPNPFQKNCVGSKAHYSLMEDGTISVLNECNHKTLDGPIKSAKGIARVVDHNSNAKLKVSFFWPFYGDYWIIDLGEDYDYAVVGHPKRKYLWILSRTKDMDQTLYDQILKRLEQQYYDTKKLIHTHQK